MLAIIQRFAGRRGVRGGRFFVAALAVLLLAAGLARAGGEAVGVARVFDGDTCRLADGRVLRLAGVDAPETAHGKAPAQYYAAEATAAFSRLVAGKALGLVVSGDGGDRFGRLLGDLVLPDGTSVTEALLAQGTVFVFWHRDMAEADFGRLLALQRRAMGEGRGMWPRLLGEPAAGRGFVGNANSRRFHEARCPEAGRISPRNRVPFTSLREAFFQGYAPARECTPWPAAGEGGRPGGNG
ncbi:MAG: thermonuclease family protein [Solidesulfovibrio sp.]|uniref:thermonuclease family protein n=1 Tax=Solidesulfovibrio sp. TaxID=2910990 RepID=UPI002B214548|nr:thermonuclease family protein [Solidesulfovibrio sp.]MEA4855772.1 thermonuclease family protein [Solidesulfovibrio sp.]